MQNFDESKDTMESPDQHELAAMRTRLANERTLLAYLRTSIGFLATAAVVYRLYVYETQHRTATAVALAFTVLAVVIMVIGLRSFVRIRNRIGHG